MKKVAIVGAGASGLIAIKCCLNEGLNPVCFEQHDDIGGIWNYTEYLRTNQGAASFRNLITNTSKETMAFSDFPMPEDYPQYMLHSQYMQYLRNYAEHFDLVKHIHFNTRVTNITRTDDYDDTGRWEVQTEDNNRSTTTSTYDAVIICTGAANSPHLPNIEGMNTEYKGRVLHMHSYRTNQEFRDKTVLVVGNQNSAGDAAADISHIAKQVYWSVGNGTTIISRFSDGNVPIDLKFSRFLLATVFPYIPGASRLVAKVIKDKQAETLINHKQYGISTNDTLPPFHGGALLVNEELKYMIISGRVKCKGNLIQLSDKKAQFSDGSSLDNIDAVLFATGYNLDLPFVDDETIKGLGRNRTIWPVYKWVFPIHLPHPTFALIALTPIGGGLAGIMELQSRWVTAVISGNRKLPSKEEMRRFQVEKQKMHKQRSGGRFQPFFVQLLEDLAKELDVNPSFWKLFKRSPTMALKAQFGPVVPALYRITGHGALPDAMPNYMKICYRAFNTPNYQPTQKPNDKHSFSIFNRFLIFGIVTLAILWKIYG